MPNPTKPPKGYKTWQGEVEGYGTIRVNVPSNITDPKVIQQHLNAEADRRDIVKKQKEGSKETVQPFSREQYPGTEGRQPALEYGEDVVKNLPSAAGRSLKTLATNPFQGFGNEEIAPVNYPENYQPNYTPSFSAFGENLKSSIQDAPIVGSLIRGAKGELSPEEASDLVLQAIGVAGGRVAPRNITEAPVRFGNAMTRVAQGPLGYSQTGRNLGRAAGMGAGFGFGSLFGRGNPYAEGVGGGFVGGEIGARVPGAVSAFRRGYGEPISARPAAPVPPVRTPASSAYGMPPALPAPSAGPYSGPSPAASPSPIVTPPTALNPGFTERLQNLKTATEGKEFSQLPRDEPISTKETPPAEETPEPKGKVTLSSAKKAAKTHNMSVEQTVKELQDSGYEVSRGPKIRRR